MRRIETFSLKRFIPAALLMLAWAAPVPAHVNSPDIYFDGWAGPYHLLVTVRPPLVIPGVAEIEIRSESPGLRELRLVPMRIIGPGADLAPVPDVAERSKADPNLFSGQLWIMLRGSWKIRILADGAQGTGELGVPAPAVSHMSLPMAHALSALLAALGLLLAIGLVSIVGAGTGQAVAPPGEEPTPKQLRRSRRLMVFAATMVVAAFFFGNKWWDAKAADVRHTNYETPRVKATLEHGTRLKLELSNPNSQWSEAVRLDDLIPDHGHLMHLFLIRAPALDRFWHLHPEETAPGVFAVDLPQMPAGRYEIFADIVHHTGFPETQVGELTLPDVSGRALEGDDSAGEAPAIAGADGVINPAAAQADATNKVATLEDGSRMVWEQQPRPLKTRQAIGFRFLVEDPSGKPVTDLQPYMGMAGHAFFVRSDFGVFAHLHPSGSVSMAAFELAQPTNEPGVNIQMGGMMPMPHEAEALPAEVSFPYGFPAPGTYRLFVQVKEAGRIETGVFDARVESPGQ